MQSTVKPDNTYRNEYDYYLLLLFFVCDLSANVKCNCLGGRENL